MISIGKKSAWLRILYAMIGISLIILIDLLFVFYSQDGEIKIMYIFFIIILAYSFYVFTKIMKLKYEFLDEEVLIHISKSKTIRLNKKSIDKIEKINNINLLKGFGIKYYPVLKENYFLTDTREALKICMDNGDVFFISPRRYPKEILSL